MTPAQQAWFDQARIDMARLLTHVEQLSRALRVEAWHRGGDPELPGGDALVMLGHSANAEAWGHRLATAERRYFERLGTDREEPWPEIADTDTDPQPPLYVLTDWADIVREQRGDVTDLRPTIGREAAYLRRHIDWIVGFDVDDEPHFMPADALLWDLEQLRRRLEAVLHDGAQHDTGAPCLECGQPLLKVWPDVDDLESEPRWHCRTCHTWSDHVQYMQAVRAAHLATATKLTAVDMLVAHHINPATLRSWAERGHVLKRGRDSRGRALYDVASAVKWRDREDATADEPHEVAP